MSDSMGGRGGGPRWGSEVGVRGGGLGRSAKDRVVHLSLLRETEASLHETKEREWLVP